MRIIMKKVDTHGFKRHAQEGTVMDILLLGCYTRFSYSLINWILQVAKISIHLFTQSPPNLLDKQTDQ